MNIPTHTNRNTYTFRKEVYQTKAATLCRTVNLFRGLIWVVAASAFLILFSAQQANGQTHNDNDMISSIKGLCEHRTLLLSVAEIEKSPSIKKIKNLLTSPKLAVVNEALGALTMSEHSEFTSVKKAHHLQRVKLQDLDRFMSEVAASGKKNQRKTLFDVMFGNSSSTKTVRSEPAKTVASGSGSHDPHF